MNGSYRSQMASPSPSPVENNVVRLVDTLVKLCVRDSRHVEYTTALTGLYDGRDVLERAASHIRKASPSCSLDTQQKKKLNAASFDFVPPSGSPTYPLWAVGRKRAPLKRKNSKRSRHGTVSSRSAILTTLSRDYQAIITEATTPLASRDEPLHLLTLPPEIRNMIFEFVIGSGVKHEAQLRKVFVPHKGGKGAREIVRRFPLQPSVCLVNRQLRFEVLSLFHGSNVLYFKYSASTSAVVDMSDSVSIIRYAGSWSAATFLTGITIQFGLHCASRVYEIEEVDSKNVNVTVRPGHRCVCGETCVNGQSVVRIGPRTLENWNEDYGLIGLAARISALREIQSDDAVLEQLQN